MTTRAGRRRITAVTSLAALAGTVLLSACEPVQTSAGTPTASATVSTRASSGAPRNAEQTPVSAPSAAQPRAGTRPAATVAPSPAKRPSKTIPAPSTATRAPGAGAAQALAVLPVKGRAPMTGYTRGQFGPAWADTDRNGCDTRNDILRRDLKAITLKPGTNGCVVLSGKLADPYSGSSISFTRGQGTSLAVQIDHVVALADAWVKGAQQWPDTKRLQFANDPLNLLAADGPLNGAKGAGDAATWLPPNKSYRCAYVARQVAVKARYGLWVTAAEKDAIGRVLTACPNQTLPTATSQPAPVTVTPGQTRPSSTVGRTPRPVATAPTGGGKTDPRFGTCRQAQAAGYGPYTRGQDVEYGWYRDGDGDGTVCE